MEPGRFKNKKTKRRDIKTNRRTNSAVSVSQSLSAEESVQAPPTLQTEFDDYKRRIFRWIDQSHSLPVGILTNTPLTATQVRCTQESPEEK
jgi:hypothetical protein